MLHLGTGLCSIPLDVLKNTNREDRGATVGRGLDCVVSINQHNDSHSKLYKFISKRHALLRLSDDGLYVKNFESKNGTFVNQTKLAEDSWVKLHENDIISLGCPARLPSMGMMNNPYSLRVSGISSFFVRTTPSTPYDSRVRDSDGGFRSWEAIKQSFMKNSQEQRSHKKQRVQASNVIDLTDDDAPSTQNNRSPHAGPQSTPSSSQNPRTLQNEIQRERDRKATMERPGTSLSVQRSTVPQPKTPAHGGRYMLKRPVRAAGKTHTHLEAQFVKLYPGIMQGLEDDFEKGSRLLADVYGRWYKEWSRIQSSKVLASFVEKLPHGYVCQCGARKHVKYPYVRVESCEHSMCLACMHRHVVVLKSPNCFFCRTPFRGTPQTDPWVNDEIRKIMRRENVMEHYKDRLLPQSQVTSMLSQMSTALEQGQVLDSWQRDLEDPPHLMVHHFILSSATKTCHTCKGERGNSIVLGIVKSPAEGRDDERDQTCHTSWHHVKCLDPNIRMHILSQGIKGFAKMRPEQKTALLKELADGTPPPPDPKKKTNNGQGAMEGGNTATQVPAN